MVVTAVALHTPFAHRERINTFGIDRCAACEPRRGITGGPLGLGRVRGRRPSQGRCPWLSHFAPLGRGGIQAAEGDQRKSKAPTSDLP
jgi:hypothetical protein